MPYFASINISSCLQHGSEYYFTKREDFERGIEAGEFLEFAHVHSNIYGTSIKAVTDVGDSGRCCILDIDVQGARKVRSLAMGGDAVVLRHRSLKNANG